MARPLRIELPGAVYHVTSRGDRREPIFVDDRDRHTLIATLAQACERFDAAVLSYCLMGNHYHLVLQTRAANLSKVMRQVNGVYTQRFNARHGMVGHLFQGRFHAVLVDRQTYLLEVCRYVNLNPVRARLVAHPSQWRWSSHAALAGAASPPAWLDVAMVWSHLTGHELSQPGALRGAIQRYVAFVEQPRPDGAPCNITLHHQHLFMGDECFAEQMLTLVAPRTAPADAARAKPSQPAAAHVHALQAWLANTPSRAEAVARTHLQSGWTMTRIAAELGLSVQHVSRLIARWEREQRREVKGDT